MSETIKVLFLSAESQHAQISLLVSRQLESISKEKIECEVFDTQKLGFKQPSLFASYRREIVKVKQMLLQSKPDILVVLNDQGIHSTFIRVSKLMHIPCLAIQDGILTEMKNSGPFSLLKWRNYALWHLISNTLNTRVFSKIMLSMGLQEAIPCWGLAGVDKIAVMGDYYKRVFIQRGVPSNKIVTTGYPLLDKIDAFSSEFRSEDFFKENGFQPDRPLIVLITQPFVEDCLWTPYIRKILVEAVIKNVKRINGQLIIKLHPREKLDAYKEIVNEGEDGIKIIRDYNLNKLLLASTAVLTVSSTAGLWALAYGKPLFVLNCFPSGLNENVLEKIGLSISNIKDLSPELTTNLKEKSKPSCLGGNKKNLYDHLYRLDGKASERIAKLIFALVIGCRK